MPLVPEYPLINFPYRRPFPTVPPITGPGAREWVIDPSVTPGAGSGTRGNPFGSIQDGLDNADTPDDRVVLLPGEYDIRNEPRKRLEMKNSGSVDYPIWIYGEGAADSDTLLDGHFQAPSTNWVSWSYNGGNLKGFVYAPMFLLDGNHLRWGNMMLYRSAGRGLQIHTQNQRNATYHLQNIRLMHLTVAASRYHNVREWHCDDWVVEDFRILWGGSFAEFARGSPGWPQAIIGRFSDNVFKSRGLVYGNWGEGTPGGPDNFNVLVEDVWSGNNYALQFYANHLEKVRFTRCVGWHNGLDHLRGNPLGPSDIFVLMNEQNPTYNGSPDTQDVTIDNMLLLGGGDGLTSWSDGSHTDVLARNLTLVNQFERGVVLHSNPTYTNVNYENLLVWNDDPSKLGHNQKPAGVTVTHTAWSDSNPPSALTSPNDVDTGVVLVDPSAMPGVNELPDLSNYLKTSGSNGRGDGKHDANYLRDFFGALRGNPPDMGFDEVSGAAPPAATINAEYSPSQAVTVAAGTAVQFTDQSTSTNPVDTWVWSIHGGNGWQQVSTQQNPSITFAAGTWSVRLVITNSDGSSTETKTALITASAAPPADPNTHSFTMSRSMPTSGATFDIVRPDISDVPTCALVFLTKSALFDQPLDGASMSIGIFDATSQRVAAAAAEHGINQSDTHRYSGDTLCVALPDAAGTALIASCSFNSFIAGGVRLNLDIAPPEGYKIAALFFSDTDAVKVGTIVAADLPSNGNSFDVTTLGSPADLVFVLGSSTQVSANVKSLGELAFGWWHAYSGTDQAGVAWYSADADINHATYSAIRSDRAFIDPHLAGGAPAYTGELSQHAQGFTFTSRDGSPSAFEEVHYLAIDLPDDITLYSWDSDGNETALTGAPFQPELALAIATDQTAFGTGTGGSMGLFVTDGQYSRGCSLSGVHNSGSSNTQSDTNAQRLDVPAADGSELTDSRFGGWRVDGFALEDVNTVATPAKVVWLALADAPANQPLLLTGTEAGTSTDSATALTTDLQLTGTDAGTSTDNANAPASDLLLDSSEAGNSTDAAATLLRDRQMPTGTEAGTGTDAASGMTADAALTATDAGASADSGALGLTFNLTADVDAGSSTDSADVDRDRALTGSESGSGADSADVAIDVALSGAEQGSSTDAGSTSLDVALEALDVGGSADAGVADVLSMRVVHDRYVSTDPVVTEVGTILRAEDLGSGQYGEPLVHIQHIELSPLWPLTTDTAEEFSISSPQLFRECYHVPYPVNRMPDVREGDRLRTADGTEYPIRFVGVWQDSLTPTLRLIVHLVQGS